MNLLTINFLKHAAAYYSNYDQILFRIKEELLIEANNRFQTLLQPDTLFLSADGLVLEKKIKAFFPCVNQLSRMDNAEKLFCDLLEIEKQAQALHTETLNELQASGQLDPERIHVLYSSEQLPAQNRLKKAITLELFRIGAADPKKLTAIAKYHYVHLDIRSQYDYYKRSIYPVLESLDDRKRFGIWAYQYKEDARVGNLIRLPVYQETELKSVKKKMLPGENSRSTGMNSISWYGVGALTNLTPNNIEEAQLKGFRSHITSDMIPVIDRLDSPDDLLRMVFPNEFYAIEPHNFFAALSVALCAQILDKRRKNHRCIFCGDETPGSLLCESCLTKIKRQL